MVMHWLCYNYVVITRALLMIWIYFLFLVFFSWSHVIFISTIKQHCKWDMTPTNGVMLESCVKDYLCAKFHLIDLASSKWAKRTWADGLGFKEGLNLKVHWFVFFLHLNSKLIASKGLFITQLMYFSLSNKYIGSSQL